LVQANVNSLPFQDEQFDKVFSIHTVYFWHELSPTISEIFRVLKPGGAFILTFCDGKNGEIWDDISSLVDEQLIPIMKNKGFFEVALVKTVLENSTIAAPLLQQIFIIISVY
jgi:ubiquinone/menaquinone biosynthesis C-methylase UbiE